MPIGAPKDLSDCRNFFLQPRTPKHRIYEALRAFFVEGLPSRQVARTFGYSSGSFQVLCHHFRRDPDPTFFVSPSHGPRSQPKKSAARELLIRLRKQNFPSMRSATPSKNKTAPSARPPSVRS